MSSWAFAIPILHGHEEEPAALAGQIHDRWDEYLGSRTHAGLTMERIFQLDTPAGSFNIVYGEGQSFHQTMHAFRTSMRFFDAWMLEQIGRLSGLDFNGMAIPPEPIQVLNYQDPDVKVRKAGIGFCAPVAWEKVGALLSFFGDVRGARSDEMLSSRRAISIWRESVFINETPMGPVVCVYIEGDDPQRANESFAASRSAFDVWFKHEVGAVLSLNLDEPLPEIRTILDWQLIELEQPGTRPRERRRIRRLPR